MAAQLAFSEVVYTYRRRVPFRPQPESVLSRFSWELPRGRTVLLGPNGAGKTTLLALGATVLLPEVGVVALGASLSSRAQDRRLMRRLIGWMPQHTRPVAGFTAREQVAYAGWLKGMGRAEAWTSALHTLDRVGLSAEAGRLVSQLSGGQQRRVGIAQCLVHDARTLLLDEPNVGLDPAQRGRFRELISEIGDRADILVSTHMVDDIASLFDTVVVIDKGEVRFEGSVAAFLALAPVESERPAESAYATLVSTDG